MLRNIWESDSFWEKSNVLWIVWNLSITILFILLLCLRPLWYPIQYLKQYFWFKLYLPKKDLEYHRQLVKNYRVYRNDGGKYSRLGEKIYRYSLGKIFENSCQTAKDDCLPLCGQCRRGKILKYNAEK